jgi:3',5'-cyclic AMP phosphodiesterase CpdA
VRKVMPGVAVLALGVLGASAGSAGAGSSTPASVFRKGPYLQNVSQTSVTLLWESERPQAGVVDIHGDAPRQIPVRADEVQEVVVSDLEPGRRYRYSVAIGSERVHGEFATAPPAGAPFSFVVFGDSRSNAAAHQRVVDRVRHEVPDFLLGTGDMVNEGASENDWQTFFAIERKLLRENVLYPSLGNHDRQGRGRTADNYRKYFSLPENSPDPERYYAFSFGSARFLVLDSNAHSFALTDQTEWIEQQLQAARLDPQLRHIFVTMHHPPYSVSLHGGQAELREAWTPLFERYQVAAVFSGHDHVYSRAEKNGVRYFVSGGGGAPLYPRKARASRIDVQATQFFERVNHYLKVHVFGDLIEISAIRADGSLIETTSWGTPPLPGSAELVARVGSGAPPEVGRAPAAPAPVDQGGGEDPGFGLFGIFGIGAVLVAAATMVIALRR